MELIRFRDVIEADAPVGKMTGRMIHVIRDNRAVYRHSMVRADWTASCSWLNAAEGLRARLDRWRP